MLQWKRFLFQVNCKILRPALKFHFFKKDSKICYNFTIIFNKRKWSICSLWGGWISLSVCLVKQKLLSWYLWWKSVPHINQERFLVIKYDVLFFMEMMKNGVICFYLNTFFCLLFILVDIFWWEIHELQETSAFRWISYVT